VAGGGRQGDQATQHVRALLPPRSELESVER
jgi:hypothetical protein